jgi:hypothetical protein
LPTTQEIPVFHHSSAFLHFHEEWFWKWRHWSAKICLPVSVLSCESLHIRTSFWKALLKTVGLAVFDFAGCSSLVMSTAFWCSLIRA